MFGESMEGAIDRTELLLEIFREVGIVLHFDSVYVVGDGKELFILLGEILNQ